jgi:hypothetical protein
MFTKAQLKAWVHYLGFCKSTEGSKSNIPCCALLARQVRATFAWCTRAKWRTSYVNFTRNLCVTYAPDSCRMRMSHPRIRRKCCPHLPRATRDVTFRDPTQYMIRQRLAGMRLDQERKVYISHLFLWAKTTYIVIKMPWMENRLFKILNDEYIRQHDKLTVVIWEMRLTNILVILTKKSFQCMRPKCLGHIQMASSYLFLQHFSSCAQGLKME